MDSEYYYKLYGNVSRMAIARGYEIEIDAKNAYYVDYEKDNFSGRIKEVYDMGGDISKVETIANEKMKKNEDGLGAFEKFATNERFIHLYGKGKKHDIIFTIIRNYKSNFLKELYLKLLVELKEKKTKHTKLCIITYKMPSTTLLKGLSDKSISFMLQKFLSYDPTLSICTPKHILLNEEEEKLYISENKIEKNHMVKIPKSDVICKWYGATVGQIFKVIMNMDGVYDNIYSIEYQVVA